ncbi:MAG: TetR/AcrR family transcriptional regulator [Sphingobacteriia bacterium]|nr:TetR/AcrR family transcriptional regulator [Sphingobacteriia bacterium]
MEIKEKILSRASELFMSQGVKNVTMDNLAADLKMSKRTLYELYENKEALVLETFKYIYLKENKILKDIVRSSSNVIEALSTIINRKKEQFQSLNPIFIEDLKKYIATTQAFFHSGENKPKEYSIMYLLLEKGMNEGIFRKDIRIDVVDNFFNELLFLVHNSKRMEISKLDDYTVLCNIFIPYFRGLCTLKGSEMIESIFSDKLNNN